MAKSEPLVIEIDGPANEAHFFRPLQRRLRGRFDLNRVAEPQARMKATEWPEAIPGLRIGLDLSTSAAFIEEPLHHPAHASTRNRVLQRGFSLAPEREDFAAVDLPTWLFWAKRAVESGVARVVSGTLPQAISGEPVKSFIVRREPGINERLVRVLEDNNRIISALLDRLTGGK